jgi:hypothetical protein
MLVKIEPCLLRCSTSAQASGMGLWYCTELRLPELLCCMEDILSDF